MRPSLQALLALAPIVLLASCGEDSYQSAGDNPSAGDPTWPEEVPEGPIRFREHVRPLLIINCLECHNSRDAKNNGNFILETRELALTTGSSPPSIVPGDPDGSPLIQVLKLDPLHQRAMPPAPDKIWGVRLEILRRWIAEGADWPAEVKLVHPAEVTEW